MTSKKSTSRWRSFRRWPRLIRWGIYSSAVLLILALIAYGIVASKYSKRASKFDLAKINQLEEGAVVLGKGDREIGRIFIEDRLFVSIDEVPDLLINAVVDTEDSRFFEHSGYDPRGIVRSAVVNFKAGKIKQGASTITQQLARHAFKLRGKTYDRKLTEVFLAKRIGEKYSKEEILEHYLNRIYLGSGYHGVGAAARGYFGKTVGELNYAEAAMLAGIIKAPNAFSPFVDLEKAKYVRNLSLGRMLANDHISQDNYDIAIKKPVETQGLAERYDRPDFALQATRREINRDVPERLDLERATVRTSLNLDLVLASIDAIQENLTRAEKEFPDALLDSESRLEGAVVVLDNKSGQILAAVGGRDYRTAPFDRALQGVRPAGTAFLPFTFGAFFEAHSAEPFAEIIDAPLDAKSVMVGGDEGMLAEWAPQVEEFRGLIPAPYALLRSKASAAVRAGHAAGVEQVIAFARRAGITSEMKELPATLLGQAPVSLIDLARSYATIANGGRPAPEPHFVNRVTTEEGQNFDARLGEESREALDPNAAMLIREVMVARMRLPRFDSVLDLQGISGSGLAGRPGSSYGFADGWFIGFDQRVTCAVWVGHRDGRRLGIENPGLELAMPIWAEVMAVATRGNLVGWPTGDPANHVCLLTGSPACDHCYRDLDGGFVRFTGIEGTPCPHHSGHEETEKPPRAVVVATDPERPYRNVSVIPKGPPVLGEDPFQE